MLAESIGPATVAGAVSGAAGALGLEIPVAANVTALGAAVFACAATAGRCVDEISALPFLIPAARPADRVAEALSVPGCAAGELQAATVAA
jgi:hypothetical protein